MSERLLTRFIVISILHKVERALRIETDALDIIDQMVTACRKAGKIALIGDYFGYGNHFPIGMRSARLDSSFILT